MDLNKSFAFSEEFDLDFGDISIVEPREDDYEELKKLYNDKQNERDILGTQLIRRNDELALLYEKRYTAFVFQNASCCGS